ncbi:heterokaryon incompatibility protein-domain-containing protein [Exophiala viscosa]|uniref:heterokaryon incompatibility protein-domain-containing protein n=1 Tax=Exophiala viscosa TaxID=2486360 RepID=UPI00219C6D30|nr:heterokaryon incompatibility protein-domain-containing protein [Exophiala viscosa]
MAIDNSKLTPSTLCVACQSIFQPDTVRSDSGETPHHGLEALAARASKCHLCLTVFMSIDPESYRIFRRDSSVESIGFAWISPIARDQARLKFRYVKMAADADRATPTSTSTSSKTSLAGAVGSENVLVVELILMNPKYAVEPGVRTIDPKSVSTGSAESFDLAKQWIEECTFNHMKCTVSESNATWKPTHLLDVSVRGPKGAPGVKLVDGMFIDPLSEYVTLSHCWGKSKPIRLHKGTLAALRQGVSTSSLPKTFAEAAMAVEKLGYRYLWIDALCIMHDNEQAVLKEISQMHRVYSEATLNISATSSRDDASGLIYSRNVSAMHPCIVEVAGMGIDDGMYKILRSTLWHDLVDSSPLSKRAWAFQERCLAKRTLHFTRNELLWECQQMCCSEVFPKGLPATIGPPSSQESVEFFSKRTHHQRHGNWHQLVKMYSPKRLTYSSDKLLAIGGLARQYMARNRLREEEYLAGLWKPQLPHALLWRVEQGRRPPKYRAPTWTWASIDGEVKYPEPAQSTRETCVEVLNLDMRYKSDRFGMVEAGKMKVRGFMARGLLRRTNDYWGRTPCVIQCTKAQVELVSASFDDRLAKLSGEGMLTEMLEVYMLPVIDVIDRVEGLLLCATMKRGEFRRIGAFDVSRYDQINWDRFRSVMKGEADMLNYEDRLDHTNGYWFASDYTYTINIV